MKKERDNKGITLIALIITIIVMLLLVGISVNVALNGGLFDTAKTAASETQLASEKETLESAVIATIATNTDLKVSNADTLKGNLPQGWTVVAADTEGVNAGTYTATSSKGNKFTVYKNGEIIDGELNQYGFFYNKEYVYYNYFGNTHYNKAAFIFLEDGTYIVKTYQELGLKEGSTISVTDFTGTKVLTVPEMKYNEEYTTTGTLDCQCTFIVDDNGTLNGNVTVNKDKMEYSDKTINVGGLFDGAVSEDGQSIVANGNTFAIEK